MSAQIFTARWVVPHADRVLAGGGVIVRRRRVERLLAGRAAVRRAERAENVRAFDAGDVALTAGLVDAHAHLELSALDGRLGEHASFASWIEALLAELSRTARAELDAAMLRAADALLASGTTSVGDIDSSGAVDRVLPRHSLRVRAYREALDAGDATRTAPAFERAARAATARRPAMRGLSPHAPYTVSTELFSRLAAFARSRRIPVAIHWAESMEEVEWLESGTGPMRRLLRDSPRARGLDSIARAGLLGPRTALIHANHPSPGDLARIRASGAVVVHCPGTHAYFDRPPFDLAAYEELGIPVALGTDSLASNRALDMRREMALARRAFPWLAPSAVWDMATRRSARALALAGRAGELAPGAWADLCAHEIGARATRASLLDSLTTSELPVRAVWVGGRAVPIASRETPRGTRRQTPRETRTGPSKTGSNARNSARGSQNDRRPPHEV